MPENYEGGLILISIPWVGWETTRKRSDFVNGCDIWLQRGLLLIKSNVTGGLFREGLSCSGLGIVSDPWPVFLPPAYVVRREGNSFTLFVCPHGGGRGGPGTPPPPPPPRGGEGGTRVRYPPRGGYPGRTTEGVLTTRRAVCLLRSRRRTFLLLSVTISCRASVVLYEFCQTWLSCVCVCSNVYRWCV